MNLYATIGCIVCIFAVLAAIILNFKTGFIHFRLIGKIRAGNTLSDYAASASSVGMAVGAQNMLASIFSVIFFGAGAILWMWLTSLVMIAVAYTERTLSSYFRKKTARGEFTGDAYSYIRDGFGSRFGDILAVIFTFASGILAIFGGGVLQTAAAAKVSSASGLPPIAIPAILVAVCVAALFIGRKRLSQISGGVSGIAILLLIISSLTAIIANSDKFLPVISSVFSSALSLKCVLGGIFSGIICSLSGFGACRTCVSRNPEPAAGGITAITSVCVSGIVIGGLSALGFLCSGVGFSFDPSTGECIFSGGDILYSAALIFAALATMLGWSAYGRELFAARESKSGVGFCVIYFIASLCFAQRPIEVLGCIVAAVGAVVLVINLIALLTLAKTATAVSRNYIKRRVNNDKSIQPMLSYYPDTQYELEKALDE